MLEYRTVSRRAHALFVIVAVFVGLLAFASGRVQALTRAEIQIVTFAVVHMENQAVKDAWKLLRDKGVATIRPESILELPGLYPEDEFPRIAAAFETLETANVFVQPDEDDDGPPLGVAPPLPADGEDDDEPISLVDFTPFGRFGPFGRYGPFGKSGPYGKHGPFGKYGPFGDFGPYSKWGPYGKYGPFGKFGPFGEFGPFGDKSPFDPEGPFGKKGPFGPEGPFGPDGPFGKKGPFGSAGPFSKEGPFGPDGPFGKKGPFGPKSTVYPWTWWLYLEQQRRQAAAAN